MPYVDVLIKNSLGQVFTYNLPENHSAEENSAECGSALPSRSSALPPLGSASVSASASCGSASDNAPVEKNVTEKVVTAEEASGIAVTVSDKEVTAREASFDRLLGRYVEVPLRNKRVTGVIIKVRRDEAPPDFKIREATLLDDGRRIDSVAFELAKTVVSHAFCTYPEAVELFMYRLPKSQRKLKESPKSERQEKTLTEMQTDAVNRIWNAAEREHLLYGVTGSGKTEVYFELIRRTLRSGKKALFLLPEISLTPQMTARIEKAFRGKRIAVIHSKITEARRARYMSEIAKGEIDIVLGARSAVLSPLRNIGIVVIDECHETSYLQENRPRYNAVEIAKRLAQLEDARLVMGSATPDVEHYYRCEKKGCLVTLPSRFADYALPSTVVIDMRHESDKLIGSQLDRAIQDRLSKREQVILFINRKGFSSTVQCGRCGYVFQCPDCAISKTYYRSLKQLRCNYCDHAEPEPKCCPECGNTALNFSGAGTEKIESEIRSRYPYAKVARIDRSVMTSNTRLSEITTAFEAGEIDILIGTQMIAKGLDFPKVTLVGIVAADLQLYIPHYLASERAFQLFTQVSGRAGRSGLRSEVMIQTYSPDHMAIASKGYADFYRKELVYRKKVGYPPYKSLATLIFSDEDERTARESAYRTKVYLRKKIKIAALDQRVKLFDEVPSTLKRLEKQYRYQLLIVSDHEAFPKVLELVSLIEEKLKATTKSQILVEIRR